MEEAHVKTGYPVGGADQLIRADVVDVVTAARNLAHHALNLGLDEFGLAVGFSFLACFAAIYLLILDRTNWRTNMLTVLLIPYIFLSLPSVLFSFLRGEFGRWIGLIVIVLRLFFSRRFPGKYAKGSYPLKHLTVLDFDWLEMPGALILLLAVAPEFFAYTIRGGPLGFYICLGIACYLLQEHIQAAGGFRNSFTKGPGVSNSIGIILVLVYPILCLIMYFTSNPLSTSSKP